MSTQNQDRRAAFERESAKLEALEAATDDAIRERSASVGVEYTHDKLLRQRARVDAARAALYRLTCEHSQSSYGVPVLVDNDGNVYGPDDMTPDGPARDVTRGLDGHEAFFVLE